MSKYSSQDQAKAQPLFAQVNPRYRCRSEKHFLKLSLQKGFEVKCRVATCSFACNDNYANKQATCLDHHLSTIPHQICRGNLTMPLGSLPSDHQRTRQEFKRILKRWATKRDCVLELYAHLHITDEHNAHWDCVAYSDAPKKPLHHAIMDAWQRAGGLRQSLVPLDDDEITAQSKYIVKDLSIQRREKRFLPAKRSIMGMNIHWATDEFWQGKTVDGIWAELIKIWFPERVGSNSKIYGSPTIQDDLCEELRARLARLDNPNPTSDAAWLHRHLPQNQDDAVGVDVLAEQHGFTLAYTLKLLSEHVADAVCTNGELNSQGLHTYNAWYIRKQEDN